MARSLVVHGPQACGKTRNAKELMSRHQLNEVVEMDELCGLHRRSKALQEGTLYLTCDKDKAEEFAAYNEIRVFPYSAAITTVTA